MKVIKHYDRLTPRERFLAMMAAQARDDTAEFDRLVGTAPKRTYTTRDDGAWDLHSASKELALAFLLLWHEATLNFTVRRLGSARRLERSGSTSKRGRIVSEIDQDDGLEDLGAMRLGVLLRAWEKFCREDGLPGGDILKGWLGPLVREVELMREQLRFVLEAPAEHLSPKEAEAEATVLEILRRFWKAPAVSDAWRSGVGS